MKYVDLDIADEPDHTCEKRSMLVDSMTRFSRLLQNSIGER